MAQQALQAHTQGGQLLPPHHRHPEPSPGSTHTQSHGPGSHRNGHMASHQQTLTNTAYGLPLTPLHDTPTFTHTRTHTPTHTSCIYPDTHTHTHGD